MLDVVFLGGKEIGFQCLCMLYDLSEKLNINIVGIGASKKGKKVIEFSKLHGLKIIDSIIPECGIIVSVQYDKILTKSEIKKASIIAVNLHMAPLPEYRGCNQFTYAILNQDDIFGVTLHKIVSNVDSGPILFEDRFTVPKKCWVYELYQYTYKHAIELFSNSIGLIVSGNYNETDQSDLIQSRSLSFHKRDEINDLKKINLDWSKDKIERHIRATSMPGFSQPYIFIGEKKCFFTLYK
jgi:methionyl-tRNA formyltransferase